MRVGFGKSSENLFGEERGEVGEGSSSELMKCVYAC